MDELEGARNAQAQRWRHSAQLARANAKVNREATRAFEARTAGIGLIPTEVLNEYADALREESDTAAQLADAVRAEAASR